MTRFILCTAAVLALAANPARAADAPERTSMTVSYSDLDLTKEAGARILLNRIRVAAASVCGPAPDIRDIRAHEAYASCTDQAVATAVDSARSPVLAALAGRQVPTAMASR